MTFSMGRAMSLRQELEEERAAVAQELARVQQAPPVSIDGRPQHVTHPVIVKRRNRIAHSLSLPETQRNKREAPKERGNETHWQYLQRLRDEVDRTPEKWLAKRETMLAVRLDRIDKALAEEAKSGNRAR